MNDTLIRAAKQTEQYKLMMANLPQIANDYWWWANVNGWILAVFVAIFVATFLYSKYGNTSYDDNLEAFGYIGGGLGTFVSLVFFMCSLLTAHDIASNGELWVIRQIISGAL